MNIRLIVIILCLSLSAVVNAQLISDILRYSYTENFSTARSLAVGDALAPLGGDMAMLAGNPAGLATFRFSEFNVSTGMRSYRAESGLANNPFYSEVNNDWVLNTLGMVITHNQPNSDWRTVNFGIGYVRNTSFDRNAFYQGSSIGSITDRWLERAQGKLWNDLLDFESGLAFDAGAIYPFTQDQDNGEYASDYELIADQPLDRAENITAEGGMGEFTIGFGGNYRDKLYVGASFGIPLIEYNSRRSYREINPQADMNAFQDLTYVERLSTSGQGVNAKLGLTYLFSQAVRWSFHYESGSRLTVLDEFSNSLNYRYDVGNGPIATTVDFPGDNGTLNAEYTMITPYQLTTGLGFIMGKTGFITAAIDFTDYRHARFIFDRDLATDADLAYERELNDQIDDEFSSAFTFRVGAEWAVQSFRFRAGVIAKQRPFANDRGFDYGQSAGLGIRINRVFFDFAMRRFHEFSTYQPYTISNTDQYEVQNVDTEDILTDFVITFGVKF